MYLLTFIYDCINIFEKFLYTENENEYYYEEENHPIKLIPELVIKHEDFGFELIDKNYIIQRIHINQPTE